MDEKMNLKGKKDRLRYFRRVDTGVIDPRVRLEQKKDGSIQSVLISYPQQDKIFFSDDEVRNFSLDGYGISIPYVDGEFTILNNYFFDFWGYYLNAEGVALYGHLRRYTYGEKDWCFPNIDLIALKMDKSRPTVLNYIELLERYGFIYKFNILNEDQENREETPIYKVRKTIPLLTQKLIEGDTELQSSVSAPKHIQKAIKKERAGLPERLHIEHDKYVEKYFNNANVMVPEKLDYEEIYTALLQQGQRKKQSKRRSQVKRKQIHLSLTKNMTEKEFTVLDNLLNVVQGHISKPSFETWFYDLLLKIESDNYTIYTYSEVSLEILQNRYSDKLTEWLKEIEPRMGNLKIELLAN
ncbi:helix-turn-helix domain-containing protein [Bacillus cihuensis]|uniref:helix-turn-helix domain-containing protein n=1 Tax=Bacillus cihuensis TaxID=1208599 RepID=UPI0004136D1C|nr:helix-turn-helix domain-containing protein [Bacillus cihuensis]